MSKFATGVMGLGMLLGFAVARAEVCTTQSQMSAADRTALVDAAEGLAAKVQAGDAAGVKSRAVADLAFALADQLPVVSRVFCL